MKLAQNRMAMVLLLLVSMLFAGTPVFAVGSVGGASVAVMVPMMLMGSHSFDGAKNIEEYADRIAQGDTFKRTKIILTLQAGLFLEKAQEELDDGEAIQYSKVLNAIGEHPLEWPEFAEIPDYAVQSLLGENMIALLKQDKTFLSNQSATKSFDKQARDLYASIRDFAYSMGYVRLFDRYFDFPGNPVITKEIKDALPANNEAREAKEKQTEMDDQVWNTFCWSYAMIFVVILLVVLGGSATTVFSKVKQA